MKLSTKLHPISINTTPHHPTSINTTPHHPTSINTTPQHQENLVLRLRANKKDQRANKHREDIVHQLKRAISKKTYSSFLITRKQGVPISEYLLTSITIIASDISLSLPQLS